MQRVGRTKVHRSSITNSLREFLHQSIWSAWGEMHCFVLIATIDAIVTSVAGENNASLIYAMQVDLYNASRFMQCKLVYAMKLGLCHSN